MYPNNLNSVVMVIIVNIHIFGRTQFEILSESLHEIGELILKILLFSFEQKIVATHLPY